MSKDVKVFFENYADDFDAIYGTKNTLFERIINKLFRKSMKIRYENVIEHCRPIAGKTVLDVGCGPGVYSIALAEKGAARVTGVDFSANMIGIAKSRAAVSGQSDRCEFIVADITACNFKKKFDYTIVMGVMDYIPGPVEFIRHLIRHTEDKIFLSFPEDKGILSAQRKYRYKKRCQLYMVTEESLRNILKEATGAEFKIEKISRDFFVTIDLKRPR